MFIVGVHRSGTSAFVRWLNSNWREFSTFVGKTHGPQDEGQFLCPEVFDLRSEVSGPGTFAWGSHLTEEDLDPWVPGFLQKAWYPYWDHTRKFLVEKSPPSLVKTRYLQAVFPESYFVCLIRHPLPTALSTATFMGEWRTSFYALLQHWVDAYNIFLEDAQHLRNVFIVHYVDVPSCGEDLQKFLGCQELSRPEWYPERPKPLIEWPFLVRERGAPEMPRPPQISRTLRADIEALGYSLDCLQPLFPASQLLLP